MHRYSQFSATVVVTTRGLIELSGASKSFAIVVILFYTVQVRGLASAIHATAHQEALLSALLG